MTSVETLRRMPLTHDDSPEFLALRWIIEKMMYAERLNALDVQSTRVEFPGHAPMVNFGSMVTSDSALIQLIRDAARQTNSSSVFVIRPTTVAPDGKRGVFCYVEALFGKIHHTYYQMYDGEGWNAVENDERPLGRLLYAPGEPIPK